MGSTTCKHKVIKHTKDFNPNDSSFYLVDDLLLTKNGIGFLNHFKDYTGISNIEYYDITKFLLEVGIPYDIAKRGYVGGWNTDCQEGTNTIEIRIRKDNDEWDVYGHIPDEEIPIYTEPKLILPISGETQYIQGSRSWGPFTRMKEYKDFKKLYSAFIYTNDMLKDILKYNLESENVLSTIKLKKDEFIVISC